MKHLLVFASMLLLAAGCTSTEEQKLHDAVSTYVRQHADKPDSYEAVAWGEPTAWMKKDADVMQANQVRADGAAVRSAEDTAAARLLAVAKFGAAEGDEEFDSLEHLHDKAEEKEMDYLRYEDSLRASTNNVQLGVILSHQYRLEDEAGTLVVDSARFVVLNDGKVEQHSL